MPQIISWLKGELRPVGIRPLPKEELENLPEDVQKRYKEIGPGVAGILYASTPFPPSAEQLIGEHRRFHTEWKKNKRNAYTKYARRILLNRLTGKSWSR